MATQTPAMASRDIVHVSIAHRQREGGGFIVRRPFPTEGLRMVDPFLMIDELGPIEYAPGEAIGAPDHPHRGFETVSYILEGEVKHEDSAGGGGVTRAGGVQWMTAGSGVVHSEMPTEAIMKEGGRTHGFQIWVNLPAVQKMTPPRYQGLEPDQIPEGRSEDGLAHVKVIAGEALGASARIDTHTPIVLQDWTLQPGASVELPIASDHQVAAYVFGGAARLGRDGVEVGDGQLGQFGKGDTVRLSVPAGTAEPARLLLLAGRPIGEPVVQYGPFVMNSPNEIRKAIYDYQAGKMGQIVRDG